MDVAAPTRTWTNVRGRRAFSIAWLLATVDLIVILVCFGSARIANWLFSGLPLEETWAQIYVRYNSTPFVIYLALGMACVVAFCHLDHYARRRPFWQEIGDIVAVVVTMAVLGAALIFLTKTHFSRAWWGAVCVLDHARCLLWLVAGAMLVILTVPLVRSLVKRLLMSRGAWLRPAVIIGAGRNAIDVASALASERFLGFEVIAFICPPLASEQKPSYLQIDGRRVPVLPAAPYPELLPMQLGDPHIVVALEMAEMAVCGAFMKRLSRHYDRIDIVSPMRGLPLGDLSVTHFIGEDILSLRVRNSLARPYGRRVKRASDILGAGLLLVLVSPLLAVIAWQVSRSGPILYGHERIGRGGSKFRCLKFRTMSTDAGSVLAEHLAEHPEARTEWEQNQKLRNDPRVSPGVAWIRRFSLDELPQLINVLRGEMSLVGPRPVVQSELARYETDVDYYVEIRPGLTGLWQVSGRNDLDYRRRVHLDCWYVRNWSLWYDVVILLKTPRAVLRGRGAY